ncbi:MAG: hypothetical protein ACHRXM_36455 [Isosphaerales bacterium]
MALPAIKNYHVSAYLGALNLDHAVARLRAAHDPTTMSRARGGGTADTE